VVRNAAAAADEDRARLDVAAEWHLGDFVNRFVPGSLVMRPPDGAGGSGGEGLGGGGGGGGDATASAAPAPLIVGPTLLYGTIGGAVGVVAPLSPAAFAWADRLQGCMRRAVRGVGGLDHAGWRAFANERGAAPARGVVDGDLVEQFLELPATVAAAVAADFGRGETAESIAKAVDDLSRACH
jgi:DNA damage-binding protein 1